MLHVRRQFATKVRLAGGQAAAAGLLGCTVTFVDHLIAGVDDKRPGLDLAFKIERVFRVPARAWAREWVPRKLGPRASRAA